MQSYLVCFLLAFIAIEHFWFMVLEMFLWKKPIGRKIFRTNPEFANQSAKLAMNQGLYNGFLASGLVWALLSKNSEAAIFFCSCVFVAGVFGALSVNKRIFFVQGLPALLALLLL